MTKALSKYDNEKIQSKGRRRLEEQEEINVYNQPVLSPQEEKKLFKQLEENRNPDQAREKIIKHNLRLVRLVALRVKRARLTGEFSFEDLLQEGVFGLIEATYHFDRHKKNRLDRRKRIRFSTYAAYWIRKSIIRAVEDKAFGIRIPIYLQHEIIKMFDIQSKLTQKLGRYPSIEELAKAMELSEKKIMWMLYAIQFLKIHSLDSPINPEDDSKTNILLNRLPSRMSLVEDESVSDSGFGRLRRRAIKQALEILTPKEREILIMRYGLDNEGSKTLEEIGEHYNLTRERIRQIQGRALKKLRANVQTTTLLVDFIK